MEAKREQRGVPWRRTLIGAVVGVVLFLYATGRLDHALYPVGLNLHECARNGYGAVFCGDELTHYRETVSEPAERAASQLQRGVEQARASEEANATVERIFGHP